ncbi:MAG TPA: nitroreductase family deazaflavin-dependent oxidoreductase [Verrucomicrobiae bacterium]|nr:nitroreductase family deazaflavin-dependent oxidoreductase [Verrucomicrobiae bacterium]
MPEHVELTVANLLDKLAGEVRSETGPGSFTKAFNETLIVEFRTNSGRLTGEFAQAPFLLLTTKGAKSGKERTTPLGYVQIDGRVLVIASMGGAPKHPAWYLNLVANPAVTVELGAENYRARAVVIAGPERDMLYAQVAATIPTFAEYQGRTDRVIPVVELRRIDGSIHRPVVTGRME